MLDASNGNALQYECDFVLQDDTGETIIRELRKIDAPELSAAVEWIEDRIRIAPDIFCKVNAVRLRHQGKVVWLKSLGGLWSK